MPKPLTLAPSWNSLRVVIEYHCTVSTCLSVASTPTRLRSLTTNAEKSR